MHNTRVSTALLRQMYERDKLGTPTIAEAVGMSEPSVFYRLKCAGVVFRDAREVWEERRRVAMPQLTKSRVVELYTFRGLSVQAVASELGLSRSVVRRFMVRHGIRRRRRAYSQFAESRYELKVSEKDLVKDYEQCWLTLAACARKHGISRETARRILVRLGVKIRSRSQYTNRCSKAA